MNDKILHYLKNNNFEQIEIEKQNKYLSLLASVYQDGDVEAFERSELNALRAELGISPAFAIELEKRFLLKNQQKQNTKPFFEHQLSSFDKELIAYTKGELEENHIFNLGKPSEILQKCGFIKNNRIELDASRLSLKANLERHKFDLLNMIGLSEALQKPIAVFEYGDKTKAQNVIVNIKKNNKNFLTSIHFDNQRNGFEISDIRTLFPQNTFEWLNWIRQGKMIYGNKEKLQTLITQQRMNDVEMNNQVVQSPLHEHCLDTINNILQSFGNVNDIYTEINPEYKKYKKNFELEHNIYSYYSKLGNLDAKEKAIIETNEFLTALTEKKTNKIIEYLTDEKKHECIIFFNEKFNSTNIDIEYKNNILKKIKTSEQSLLNNTNKRKSKNYEYSYSR